MVSWRWLFLAGLVIGAIGAHRLTGVDPGDWDGQEYPSGSLLAWARERALAFWKETVRGPKAITEQTDPEVGNED